MSDDFRRNTKGFDKMDDDFLTERRLRFKTLIGDPKTPAELSEMYITYGRQLGKTTLLLETIPDEPCHLVATTQEQGKYLIERLLKDYPHYKKENYQILVAKSITDLKKRVSEAKYPVFVDNMVYDVILTDLIYELYGSQK